MDKLNWLGGLGGHLMQMAIFDITPERADALLEINTENPRPMTNERAAQFANTILAGSWKLTHQGVAISRERILLDGQHRLMGIVRAGKTVPMVVSWNVSEDVRDAIDVGKSRLIRQVLQGIGSRAVEALSFVANLHGVKYIQPHHVRVMYEDVAGVAIDELLAVSGRSSRARSSAGVRAAAMLRYMQHPEHVAKQWRALQSLDYPSMVPSVQALTRQLTDDMRRVSRNDRAARAWVAFDPKRAGISRISIQDLPGIIDEMKRAYVPPFVGEGR